MTFEILAFAELNARLQPLDRGDIYEDPLDDVIQADKIGEVTGGGTLMMETGELARADLELALRDAEDATLNKVIDELEKLGAPKGSRLIWGDGEEDGCVREFGVSEGLALYLNGTDLDPEVYASNDVNELIENLQEAADGIGRFDSYWEGGEETALYFYGDSFEAMKSALAPVMDGSPLCQKSRLEQIA